MKRNLVTLRTGSQKGSLSSGSVGAKSNNSVGGFNKGDDNPYQLTRSNATGTSIVGNSGNVGGNSSGATGKKTRPNSSHRKFKKQQ